MYVRCCCAGVCGLSCYLFVLLVFLCGVYVVVAVFVLFVLCVLFVRVVFVACCVVNFGCCCLMC